jgi:hypothetical protein
MKSTKFEDPHYVIKSHDSSAGIALGYRLDNRGSRVQFPAGAGIFLFTTMSRMALGPTQPPIQWVPGALSLGVKRLEREADHSPPSSAKVKEWVELYLHFPNAPSWRSAQLKHRSNFTFLPFTLCNYPHPPATSWLGPNILLSTITNTSGWEHSVLSLHKRIALFQM